MVSADRPIKFLHRLPFLLLAIACLLTGLATGLNRLGWNFDLVHTSLDHGAIMVGGFLGTLIALEKVIPLKRKALLFIPFLSGASVVLFFMGNPKASYLLLLVASLALSGIFLRYLLSTRDVIYLLMLCGGLCWFAGNLLLATRSSYPSAFPWWIGFILFIITAERLELTKFLPVTKETKRLLVILLYCYAAGVAWTFHEGGNLLSGTALVAISIWLMKNDIVGISIRKQGLQRFIATALLGGYIAMLLTGVLLITAMDHVFAYDAVIHTFFLGFAFSMIFAHAPVILPSVLGLSVKPWHRLMYVWLGILHGSLIARVGADFLLDLDVRKFSGIATVVGITGYFATVAILTMNSQRKHAKVL